MNKNSDAFADVSLLGLQLRVTEDRKGRVSFSIGGMLSIPDLILLVKIATNNKNISFCFSVKKSITLSVRANSALLRNLETKLRSH